MLFSKVDLFGNPDVSLPEVESSAEVLNSYGSAHVSSIKRGHRVSIYDLLVDNLSKPVARFKLCRKKIHECMNEPKNSISGKLAFFVT